MKEMKYRLRKVAMLDASNDEHLAKYTVEWQAADLLEQQSAEIERLNTQNSTVARVALEAEEELEALQSQLDTAIQSSAHWQHQCTELQAKLSAMESVEPIGYVIKDYDYTGSVIREKEGHYNQPVYTAPKVAQPLTDDEFWLGVCESLDMELFGWRVSFNEGKTWTFWETDPRPSNFNRKGMVVMPIYVKKYAHNIGGQQP